MKIELDYYFFRGFSEKLKSELETKLKEMTDSEKYAFGESIAKEIVRNIFSEAKD